MKIRWTSQALKSYSNIIDFLSENWTKKEIDKFITEVDSIIEQIQENPYMYQATNERKNLRKGFVNKLISLFYRVQLEKDEIELLKFWDNRQNRNKLKL